VRVTAHKHTQTHLYSLSDCSDSVCLLLPVSARHVSLHRVHPPRYLQPCQQLLRIEGGHGEVIYSVVLLVVIGSCLLGGCVGRKVSVRGKIKVKCSAV
jgi:hypothetical protein